VLLNEPPRSRVTNLVEEWDIETMTVFRASDDPSTRRELRRARRWASCCAAGRCRFTPIFGEARQELAVALRDFRATHGL